LTAARVGTENRLKGKTGPDPIRANACAREALHRLKKLAVL
jgi:hypothetical protein